VHRQQAGADDREAAAEQDAERDPLCELRRQRGEEERGQRDRQ
jgi:hypothetical protein